MKQYSVNRLAKIAISLSIEKDLDNLLDAILKEAMQLTSCDGGTVYIYDPENDCLHFHRMITVSKGISSGGHESEITLPPVKLTRKNVCACCAMDNKRINIADVYTSDTYDFSGAQKYDSLNDYRTASMLVIPMEDSRGNVIGVLQLINALSEEGHTIPFADEYEEIIAALASLAAISLTNRKLAQDVSDILHSFVRVMVEAVDKRTPYNASHTRHMVRYAERFLLWLDETEHPLRFPENDKDPFLMSVWLHDIGKLVVPLAVMDKPTRLGAAWERIKSRIEIARLMVKVRGLQHPEEQSKCTEEEKALCDAWELIQEADQAPFLPGDRITELNELSKLSCATIDGGIIPLLTEDELTAITVRKGTLTDAERREMEKHVEYTADFLNKMKFGGYYEKVPEWASSHHEFLNGSGYPAHKTAEELPKEVRLLTILDIFDALTAEDRPYKPPMPKDRAFIILHDMAAEGKLDEELVALFEESGAWE
ncbi:MAG: GAF domain-containing protein [Lachnospiraceae bacterium]|nr:GAF domain-containing protein [Lachnospiraceae bacterium]